MHIIQLIMLHRWIVWPQVLKNAESEQNNLAVCMYITDASGSASSNVLIYQKYTYCSYFVVDDLIRAFLEVLRAVYGQNHVNAAFKNTVRITCKCLILNLNINTVI